MSPELGYSFRRVLGFMVRVFPYVFFPFVALVAYDGIGVGRALATLAILLFLRGGFWLTETLGKDIPADYHWKHIQKKIAAEKAAATMWSLKYPKPESATISFEAHMWRVIMHCNVPEETVAHARTELAILDAVRNWAPEKADRFDQVTAEAMFRYFVLMDEQEAAKHPASARPV